MYVTSAIISTPARGASASGNDACKISRGHGAFCCRLRRRCLRALSLSPLRRRPRPPVFLFYTFLLPLAALTRGILGSVCVRRSRRYDRIDDEVEDASDDSVFFPLCRAAAKVSGECIIAISSRTTTSSPKGRDCRRRVT